MVSTDPMLSQVESTNLASVAVTFAHLDALSTLNPALLAALCSPLQHSVVVCREG